jgi:hypothetical protein
MCCTTIKEKKSEDVREQGAEKIFGSMRQELMEDCRKFHSKDLNDLHLLLTNPMVQIFYLECCISAASKEIRRIL